jgi:hypothetical protein
VRGWQVMPLPLDDIAPAGQALRAMSTGVGATVAGPAFARTVFDLPEASDLYLSAVSGSVHVLRGDDDDRAVGVVSGLRADRAHDQLRETACATRAEDDHFGVLGRAEQFPGRHSAT